MKIAVWKQAGGAKGLQGAFISDAEFRVKYEGMRFEGLSVSKNPLEEKILGIIKNSFILDNAQSWQWGIGSAAHNDEDFNAVDLNLPAGDDKKNIYAPSKGTVVHNQKDSYQNPTLVLEHETEVNGQIIYWYTKYLHMYADAEGKSGPFDSNGLVDGLEKGTVVEEKTTIAQAGGFGLYSTGSHVHFVIFAAPDGKRLTNFFDTNGMDLRILLTDKEKGLGMSVDATAYKKALDAKGKVIYVSDGPGYSVQWEPNLKAYVADGPNLIYNRSELLPGQEGNESYWIAWHKDITQRKRVIWVGETEDHVKINEWIAYDDFLRKDFSKKWDSSTQLWVTR